MNKFKVGDRVVRKPLKRDEVLRHGVIYGITNSYRDYMGQTRVIYSVLWDDTNELDTGYIEVANGLDFETN